MFSSSSRIYRIASRIITALRCLTPGFSQSIARASMSASETTPLASSPAEKPLYFVPRNRTFVEDDDDSSKALPAPSEPPTNKGAPKGYQAIGKDAPTAEVRRMRAALPRKVNNSNAGSKPKDARAYTPRVWFLVQSTSKSS
jgi:hypothetical protein